MRTEISIYGPTAQAVISSQNFSLGAARILVERHRVTDQRGITTEADAARYEFGELVYAALAYISGPNVEAATNTTQVPSTWPFHPDAYRGGSDRIEDLVRAGQFIAAEIDRLSFLAEVARNPKPVMSPEDRGEVVPGRGKILKRLTGYRAEGERTANPNISETASVFEPGEGSDPASWFDGVLLEAGSPVEVSGCPCGNTKPHGPHE